MGGSIPLGCGDGTVLLQRDDCLFKLRPDTERDRAFGKRQGGGGQGAARKIREKDF